MRGDKILEIEKNQSDLDICYVLKEVRGQGATDNDIKMWWNMPDEQHEEIMREDDMNCNTTLEQWISSGISREDAIAKLRKGYPIFESYKPGVMHPSDDDNLPYELKIRINNFFDSPDKLLKFKEDIEKSPSMNAFIRSLIRKGVL